MVLNILFIIFFLKGMICLVNLFYKMVPKMTGNSKVWETIEGKNQGIYLSMDQYKNQNINCLL